MSEYMSTAKLKKDVMKYIVEQPLSLAELAQKMGLKEKRVFRLLRSLFEAGEITSLRGMDGIRKYRPTTNEEKSASKAEDEGEVVDVEDDEDDDE